MGKLIGVIIFLLAFKATVKSQMSAAYAINASIADSLFGKRQYQQAADFYEKARADGGSYLQSDHLFNQAFSYYKTGRTAETFRLLYMLVYGLRYSNCEYLLAFYRLPEIQNTSEFKEVLANCRCNQKIAQLPPIPSLSSILDSLYEVDQASRTSSKLQIVDRVPAETTVKNINLLDSLYRIYGWLSYSQVGSKGESAQFLMIQHSSLKMQKKWLPRVEIAAAGCLTLRSNLALLIDRIRVRQGKKQIYGTQFRYDKVINKYIPFKILDPEKLDERRAKMGMNTFSESLKEYDKR